MNPSIASDERWGETSVNEQVHEDEGTRPRHTFVGLLKDAGLLLLIVLACPLVILAIGAPVALVVRLLIEIAGRW